jgi:hypothetical protein
VAKDRIIDKPAVPALVNTGMKMVTCSHARYLVYHLYCPMICCSHLYLIGLPGDRPLVQQHIATDLGSESGPTIDGPSTHTLQDIKPNDKVPAIRDTVCISLGGKRTRC